MLLGQSTEDVDKLLDVLRREGTMLDMGIDPVDREENEGPPPGIFDCVEEKRNVLGLFLARQSNLKVEE